MGQEMECGGALIRLLALLLLAMALPADEPIKILIVTGGHEHPVSFYSLFDDARFSTEVEPHPGAFTGDFRQRADVLVLYDMMPEIDEKKRENLKAFVDLGKGVVVLHHAIGDGNTWPWWYEQVVGGRYLFRTGGGMPASSFKHDERVRVKVVKNHPVTAGVSDFVVEDETYKGMSISPKVEVLLTTDNPTSDGPLAWLGLHPTARVVYIQLGHGTPAHRDSNYRQLVKNAIFWAAHRNDH